MITAEEAKILSTYYKSNAISILKQLEERIRARVRLGSFHLYYDCPTIAEDDVIKLLEKYHYRYEWKESMFMFGEIPGRKTLHIMWD